MQKSRRVVITGMGPVTPIGVGVNNFSENMFAGKNGISKIADIDTSKVKAKIAGQVLDFNDYANMIDGSEIQRMDRGTQFSVVASILAAEDSGINFDKEDKSRITVSIGSSLGAIHSLAKNLDQFEESGTTDMDSCFIPMIMGNIMSAQVAMHFGITGKCKGVFTACATGGDCIGEAYEDIMYGRADLAFAGATDASVHPAIIGGFQKLRVINTRSNDAPEKASRPFDKNRNGFVIAEGCGMVILEELEHALKRGAKIYAEIVGYGSSADAFSLAAPLEDGRELARCMQNALDSANLKPEDIDYINAHGTSTKMNDIAETRAIKKVFGEHAHKLALSSTKSMTGHTLAAAGAIECIATALAIKEQVAPPTINCETPDEELGLDCVPNTKRAMKINYALSDSVGFGGHNASIVLKKFIK